MNWTEWAMGLGFNFGLVRSYMWPKRSAKIRPGPERNRRVVVWSIFPSGLPGLLSSARWSRLSVKSLCFSRLSFIHIHKSQSQNPFWPPFESFPRCYGFLLLFVYDILFCLRMISSHHSFCNLIKFPLRQLQPWISPNFELATSIFNLAWTAAIFLEIIFLVPVSLIEYSVSCMFGFQEAENFYF